MNLSEYIKDATRTESRIEKVVLEDSKVLIRALKIFIASGNILDMYKKNVFYTKPIDWHQVVTNLEEIEQLTDFLTSGESQEIDIDPRVFHALIGIATEATELMEAMLASINGAELDRVNLLEESFDCDWYQFILHDALDADMKQTWDTGIEKLRKRFPEKFTSEDAIKRDLDEERNILEAGLTS